MRTGFITLLTAVTGCLLAAGVYAEPFAAPGDTGLRNDLQLLNDSGVINITLTAWPVAWVDVERALLESEDQDLAPEVRAARSRVRQQVRANVGRSEFRPQIAASGANNLPLIRTFEDTPREEGEIEAGLSWMGDRFSLNLQGTYVNDPSDGDELRPDGTYVGAQLGNWMLSAGWQERWWGPGRNGSMILSTNARPMPSIGLQRIGSIQSQSKWFRWIGPWTLSTFMSQMDDERHIEDGLVWGFRFSMRPVRGLEIGISRTAQWCGEDRPCDLETFLRVLHGNDNRGANVDPEDEPGNQLGGIDIRWALPKQIPSLSTCNGLPRTRARQEPSCTSGSNRSASSIGARLARYPTARISRYPIRSRDWGPWVRAHRLQTTRTTIRSSKPGIATKAVPSVTPWTGTDCPGRWARR